MNKRGMKCCEPVSRRWVIVWLACLASVSPLFAQCGQPLPTPPPPGNGGMLLYSLRGQTVQVDGSSGGFSISNVSAPDVFPADFKGDDYLYLTGMKITDQGITYVYSVVPF